MYSQSSIEEDLTKDETDLDQEPGGSSSHAVTSSSVTAASDSATSSKRKKDKAEGVVNLGTISRETIKSGVTNAAVGFVSAFASWIPNLDFDEDDDPVLRACRDSSQY